MKKLLSLTLAMVMLFSMFAGCTKEEPVTTTAAPATEAGKPTEATTAAPEKIRTDIIIADTTDIKTLDPHAANDGYSARVFNQIYDPLMKQTADLEVAPALAESWEFKSDTEIIFYIRKGVKFHNGDELKASDVKFSIDRMVASPSVKSYFDKITEVTVIDDYTVSVKTSEPYAPLMFNLAGTYGSIVSEKAITEAGDKYNENPIGTGPMKFKEWAANDHVTVVRNDDYWRGTPKATSITIRVIPEDSSRTIALQAGDVDFLQATPAVDVARIMEDDSLKTETYLSQSAQYIGFNCKKAPFDNVKVRQALNYAVDRQTIVDVVLEGKGQVISTVLAPDMPGANNEIDYYPYDVEKAKSLLAEAGYPDGFTASIMVYGDANNKIGQLVQSDFAKIGVELNVELTEFGAMLEYLNLGEHDMYTLSYGAAGNPDSTFSNVYHGSSSSASGNRSYYSNPEVDKLIDEARVTMEWEDREPIYQKVQELIMQDAPIIPLYSEQKYYAMNANMEGYTISKNAKHDFYNAYIVEK